MLIMLALALTTPLGPALIEKITSATFTPLKIKGFHGSFLTDLKVNSLKWKNLTTTVELEQIKINRPRYNMEKNQLNSIGVSAKRLLIRVAKSNNNNSSKKITSLPNFALPLDINTKTLTLESFAVIYNNKVVFQIKDIVLGKLAIEKGKLTANTVDAQLITIGSPLDMKVQDFVMNMNQPHDMKGHGSANFKHPQIGKANANFELGGTLVNYEFKVKANLENEYISPQAIQLEGAGNYDQLAFSSIKSTSLDANIKGKAELKWTPELIFLFDGKLQQVKLKRYLLDWPAEFDASVNYQGGYKNNSFYGELDLQNLEGSLKGKKISVQGKLQHKDQQLTLNNIQAYLGQNKIKTSGNASPPFDLSWDISAHNLSQLLPDSSLKLSGQLTAKGTLKGTLEQPLLNGEIKARELHYQHYKIATAELIAESKQGIYRLHGNLNQLDLEQQKISDAKLDAFGTVEKHTIQLAFTHTDAKVKLKAQGGWKAPKWQGSLQQLLLDTKQVSKWQLQQPVQISTSKDQLKTTKLCLANNSAHTCSTLHWSADTGIDIEGDLKRTPLALLNPFLPKDIILKGNTNGRYKIKQQNNNIIADIALQLPAGLVSYGKNKNKQLLHYKSLTLKALIDGQKITAQGKLLLKNKGELSADANIVLAKTGNNHQIDANGKLTRIPLFIARPWLPKDITLNGSANGSFKLKQKNAKTIGDVTLRLPASSIVMGKGKQKQKIEYKSLVLKALINGRKITANTRLFLKNKGKLEANANILLTSNGTNHQIDAKGKLKHIPLAMAKPWLPKDILLKGNANGSFKLKQKNAKTIADVTLQLPTSSVVMGEGKQKQKVEYKLLTLKAVINGQKISANSKLILKNRGELEANANIILAKNTNNHQINAKGKLKHIPLIMAKPWLPKGIQLNGSATGNFKLKQKNGKAVGNVSLHLPASSVLLGEGKQKQRINYQSLTLNALINDKKISANTRLVLKNHGELTANTDILLAKNGNNHHIIAKGKLTRIPLAMVKPWLPKELQLRGSASGHFNLKPQNDKLAGDVLLQLPASSIVVAKGKEKQQIDYKIATLKAIINGNKISANSKLLLKNNAKLSADISINLANKKRGNKKSNLKVSGKGKLTRMPLAMLQPWMPQLIQLKGSASGKFNIKQVNGKPVGDVSLLLPASSIFIGEGKTKEKINYRSLILKAIINNNKITANTRLLLQNKGELSADANIILDSKGNNHQIDAKGKLNRIPLTMAKPWLPETLLLNGLASGGFKLKQNRRKTTGNLIVQLPHNSLSIINEAGSITKFDYQNAFIKASISNKIITANAKMQLNKRADFSANARILLATNNKAHRIQGTATFDIPNIHWMQNFVPQTTNLYGKISSKINFNGRLTAPRIIGQIALQDASLKLPKVGTHLRHINLSVKANDANRAIINGSLVSGQGKATLQGFISLKDLKKLNGEMRLRGTNLQFINTHEAVGLMTPDITIKMNPKTVDILGNIHIPSAKITLNAIPEASIDESEDVIVIGEKKPNGNFSAVKIRPNLIVSLGKQVKFQGFGLDTQLGGSVRVTHNNQVIVTQGSIKIHKGRYQAYGQNLIINNGRLVFNGPPTNVGMDIKALRKIDDINAGIHLTGTLHKPKTKLFSSPSLSESNILSYLLTGHSMDEITGSQTALLLQAVRSMNVSGGEGLERSIGNSLGLDDLSIIPKEDLKKSELRLGKKLGSKLYVRYIVGIFDAAQRIALEYKVNKYLNLEAQAGADAQSLDLIYQIETR
jgi:autotransporter translocation and assembly factor TamB